MSFRRLELWTIFWHSSKIDLAPSATMEMRPRSRRNLRPDCDDNPERRLYVGQEEKKATFRLGNIFWKWSFQARASPAGTRSTLLRIRTMCFPSGWLLAKSYKDGGKAGHLERGEVVDEHQPGINELWVAVVRASELKPSNFPDLFLKAGWQFRFDNTSYKRKRKEKKESSLYWLFK